LKEFQEPYEAFDGPFREPVMAIERSQELHIQIPLLVAVNAGCIHRGHINDRSGYLFDPAGYAAMIRMEMTDIDPINIADGSADLLQGTFEFQKCLRGIHPRIKQGHPAVMNQGKHMDVFETKGHGQGDHVKIFKNLLH
jgi:hypothetical protein